VRAGGSRDQGHPGKLEASACPSRGTCHRPGDSERA
jgi:hypothetical protein